jgi:hypothetical protein
MLAVVLQVREMAVMSLLVGYSAVDVGGEVADFEADLAGSSLQRMMLSFWIIQKWLVLLPQNEMANKPRI